MVENNGQQETVYLSKNYFIRWEKRRSSCVPANYEEQWGLGLRGYTNPQVYKSQTNGRVFVNNICTNSHIL